MAEPEMKKPGIMDGAGEWYEDEHPRDGDGKFTSGGSVGKVEALDLGDEFIGKSVGTKVRNFDIRLADGKTAHLAEGTYLRNKEVFAGKGTKIPIRQEDNLIKIYGGKKGEWAKVKGHATLEVDGKTFEAEVHWYEEPGVGKVDMKHKEQ